jgi:hypothetical protein
MNVVLTDIQCKVCKVRLTEYEANHQDALCIECYKEKIQDNANQNESRKNPSL